MGQRDQQATSLDVLADCCRRTGGEGWDRTETVGKATSAILACIFNHMPTVPAASKWTKLYPALDYIFAAAAPHTLITPLYTKAFGELTVKTVAQAKVFAAGAGPMNADLVQDVCWHAVAGMRLMATFKLISDHTKIAVILMLAIVLEPLRFFTYWLLKVSSATRDFRKAPPICTVVNLECSPMTVIRQYYSCLLAGDSPRLQIIYRRFGYTRFDQFATCCPAAKTLRRLILVAENWFFRRHWQELVGLRSWPWKAARIVDKRLHRSERIAAAREVLSSNLCCMDPFFWRRFRILYPSATAEDLCDDAVFQKAILMWAWAVMLTIAIIECKHGRNKRSADYCVGWEQFVAKYILRESRQLLESRTACLQQMCRSIEDDSATSVPVQAVAKRPVGEFMNRIASCKRSRSAVHLMASRECLEARMSMSSAKSMDITDRGVQQVVV